MEACGSGHVEIIRLLLQRGASVQQEDDDGWTAVDHLTDYLTRNQTSLDVLEELLQLKDIMEDKQRAGEIGLSLMTDCFEQVCFLSVGLIPRQAPPPRRAKPSLRRVPPPPRLSE